MAANHKIKDIIDNKDLITSDDILGKDVIDSKGNNVGMVTQMHIDKTTKSIIGISIDSGFMKPFVYIGIDHIINFGIDSVYIQRTPSSKYLGLTVFDKFGEPIGNVIHVNYDDERDTLVSLTIRAGIKKLEIPHTNVKTIARNVILNVERQEIMDS
ncbi:PRC-barrel domain-containing protein [Candidatus Woesearchaeota archaeon]|nr:PRC-barrel domain-containing protein [Candidatus Woesearchaeota archaeon]